MEKEAPCSPDLPSTAEYLRVFFKKIYFIFIYEYVSLCLPNKCGCSWWLERALDPLGVAEYYFKVCEFYVAFV